MSRAVLVGSIPSPPTGIYHVGPLTVHMYGVMLLLAIAAAIWLTGVRWVRWGGDWDLVFRMAIWGVRFGIIGARIYHLITSWNQDAAIHAHWIRTAVRWDEVEPNSPNADDWTKVDHIVNDARAHGLSRRAGPPNSQWSLPSVTPD